MGLKLEKLDKFEGRKGPLLFIVMDGVGFGRKDESDAVFLAKTPTLDKLLKDIPLQAKLKAHGPAVGTRRGTGQLHYGTAGVFAHAARDQRVCGHYHHLRLAQHWRPAGFISWLFPVRERHDRSVQLHGFVC